MKRIRTLGRAAFVAVAGIVAGLPFYALPATISLRPGRHRGLEALTPAGAVRRVEATGKTGAALVEAAVNAHRHCRTGKDSWL